MKKFFDPEIDVTKFVVEDVITTSASTEPEIEYADEDASVCSPIG